MQRKKYKRNKTKPPGKRINSLVLFSLLFILACSKEESGNRLSEFDWPIITGYEVRDLHAETMGNYGIPNIKLGNESNSQQSEYFFVVAPNPITNSCTVYIDAPNPTSIKQIWIVQAQYQDNISNMVSIVGSSSLNMGGNALVETETTSETISFDLSFLSEGYYRIYLKIDDQLFYDNLAILKN